jgi:hypothetical protein
MTSPSISAPSVSTANELTIARSGTVNQYQPSTSRPPGFENVWSTEVSARPSRTTARTACRPISSVRAGAPGAPWRSTP